MSTASFASTRPILVSAVFILLTLVGISSYKSIAVDKMPDVTFPVVAVVTSYYGTAPEEIDEVITTPIENLVKTVANLDNIVSYNEEGRSLVIITFNDGTDINIAKQEIRDKVAGVTNQFPDNASDPIFFNFDPNDSPIVELSLSADLTNIQLYDLAKDEVSSYFESIANVASVSISGAEKREIKVLLESEKLNKYNLSATTVSTALSQAGENIAAGTITSNNTSTLVRTLGSFSNLKSIEDTLVSFYGNETPVKIKDIATVVDSQEQANSKSFVNGKPAVILEIFKQTGANTVEVADNITKQIAKLKKKYTNLYPGFNLQVLSDDSQDIKNQIWDVTETILIGILLVFIVVFFFLGSLRATLITSIAIPNSIISAFTLILLFGFTINVMTLLAITLAVGLLIDDAIVVRENIFRHMQVYKKSPLRAAIDGTNEVFNAVLGTSLTVLAVFAPVAFMDGIIGQFFQQFALTVCAIIFVSTLDAIFLAPMLSAYFAKPAKEGRSYNPFKIVSKILLHYFEIGYSALQKSYLKLLSVAIKSKKSKFITFIICFSLTFSSFGLLKSIPKTFLPDENAAEFNIDLKLPAETALDKSITVAQEVDTFLHNYPEIDFTLVKSGGNSSGDSNDVKIYVKLVDDKKRDKAPNVIKNEVREDLVAKFPQYKPRVKDVSRGPRSGGFNFRVVNHNSLDMAQEAVKKIITKLRENPQFTDVRSDDEPGKPELQITLDDDSLQKYGLSKTKVGAEISNIVDGKAVSNLRANSVLYDIRVKLNDAELKNQESLKNIFVPNINNQLIPLNLVATITRTISRPSISKYNGIYASRITGTLVDNANLGAIVAEINTFTQDKTLDLPKGTDIVFSGDSENQEKLMTSFVSAMMLGIIFIFLILASLYGSVITPITIMLVLPFAIGGAIYGLYIGNKSLDLFSMIGFIMLMAVALKNSIILVDYITQLHKAGLNLNESIYRACSIRFRPILMTSISLIAGMVPLAIGLNEISSQRTSMGYAVIGGTIASTLLTLFTVPVIFAAMLWIQKHVYKLFFTTLLVEPDKDELRAILPKSVLEQEVAIEQLKSEIKDK